VEGDAGRAPAPQGCHDVPVGADAMFGRGVRRVCCCRRVDRPASPGAPAHHGTQISRNSSFIDTSPDTVSSLFLVETGSALKWGADTL
jgi:hypothetical protein